MRASLNIALKLILNETKIKKNSYYKANAKIFKRQFIR